MSITNVPDCITKLNNAKGWMKNYVMADHPIIKDLEEVVKFLKDKKVVSTNKSQFDGATFFNHKTNPSVSLELEKIKKEQKRIAQHVLSVISEEVRIPAKEILVNKRNADIVAARGIYYYILRKNYKFNFHLIGSLANGKNHSSVVYGINKVDEWMETRKDFKSNLNNCIEKLNQ